MTKLQELINNILETEKIIGTDPNDYPYQTRPGFEMRRNQAKTQIEDLKTEYRKGVADRVAKIFIVR